MTAVQRSTGGLPKAFLWGVLSKAISCYTPQTNRLRAKPRQHSSPLGSHHEESRRARDAEDRDVAAPKVPTPILSPCILALTTYLMVLRWCTACRPRTGLAGQHNRSKPLSAIRFPVSAIRCPNSAIRPPLSAIRPPMSGIRRPLSGLTKAAIRCPLSVVRYPSSAIRCPLSAIRCPLSESRYPGAPFLSRAGRPRTLKN